MSAFNPGVYKAILRVRPAYIFDAGGMLMRFYGYMLNIGTVTMLTLAGYSFFIAGLVSAAIAICIFLISPRISKLIDAKGQSKILPFAGLVTLLGLAAMLMLVAVHGPEWALFVAAVFMGFFPNPQALVRARWTYLIRTGKLGSQAPDLRTMFSYEGVLDDIGFMFSPAISIALATAITPIAGLTVGGLSLALGIMLLTLSQSTEPEPGWVAADEETDQSRSGSSKEGAGDALAVEGSEGVESSRTSGTCESVGVFEPASSALAPHYKSIFRTSSMVRVLFLLMLFVGAFFGIFDTSTVALAEELGDPNIASTILMIASFVSMVMGFVFGMINLRLPAYKQLLLCAVLAGGAYATMAVINSVFSLYAVSLLGALFYAPFLIVANSSCEKAVPGDRLTEAITWMNTGATCGLALGPSIGGFLIDLVGASAGFQTGALFALCVPVTAFLCLPIMKKRLRQ